jgi:hypothetical protein
MNLLAKLHNFHVVIDFADHDFFALVKEGGRRKLGLWVVDFKDNFCP